MPPIIEDRFLGGPGQAFQNILVGDLEGAVAALNDPTNLTPGERDTFLKRHGLDKGVYAPVFRLLTNPAVIVTAALSMKFPVPTAANMFKLSEKVSGYTARFPILRGLSSMQSLFRGTPVPETYSQILTDVNDFRSKYAGRFGTALEKFRQSTGQYPGSRDQKMMALWLDGMHRSTGNWFDEPLAPALEAHMTPALKSLAKEVRGALDDIYGDIFGDAPTRAKVASAIAKSRKAGFADPMLESLEEWIKNPTKMEHYYPRRVISTDADFRAMVAAMTQSGKEAQFKTAAVQRTMELVGPNALKRKHAMLPNLHELEEIKDVLDPATYEKLRTSYQRRILDHAKGVIGPGAIKRLEKLDPKQLTEYRAYSAVLDAEDANRFSTVVAENAPRTYDLKASHALNGYIHTMASTYGWTVRDGGEKMMGYLNELRVLGMDPTVGARAKRRLAMLENTYIPIALGRGTFQQALKAQAWEQSMLRLSETLDTPNVQNLLGDELHRRVQDSLRDSRGAFALTNLQRGAASYFYLSTLGVNPASAVKNLLQPILTTGPVVGFSTAARGALEAFKKSSTYFSARYGRGLSHDDALRAAFPDFAEAGLVATPLTDEAVANTLQNAYALGAKLPSNLVSAKEKVARSMMAMFSASEIANRVSAFEAGMFHAKRSGMALDESIKFSKKLVETTQFLTGPANTPYGLLDKSPLTRQLLQFPLKMVEFATDSALTIGSGERNVFGLNPGTFSRAVLGSVIAYELGSAVGVDVSNALLSSALPGFQEPGKVLAPLPLVPPAYQLMGAAAFGLASGDWEELRRASSLMVPGGVAASRAVGAIPGGEGVAKFLGRQYADYDQPSPTGRVAVYTSEGRLRGFFTPWEIVLMGSGIRVGDDVAEQQLLQTLVANRDDIRAERQAYIEALIKNDPRAAEAIGANFKKRYGVDIPVSRRDIESAQMRRSVPRLQHVLQTLPPGPLRDQYAQAISVALGQSGAAFMGGEPATASTRRPVLGATTPLPQAAQQPQGRPAFSVSQGVQPSALSRVVPDADQFSGF